MTASGGREPDPGQEAVAARLSSGAATDEDRALMQGFREDRSRRLLERHPEALFTVEELHAAPPPLASVHASVVCRRGGEGVRETRIRRLERRDLCLPGFEQLLAGP